MSAALTTRPGQTRQIPLRAPPLPLKQSHRTARSAPWRQLPQEASALAQAVGNAVALPQVLLQQPPCPAAAGTTQCGRIATQVGAQALQATGGQAARAGHAAWNLGQRANAAFGIPVHPALQRPRALPQAARQFITAVAIGDQDQADQAIDQTGASAASQLGCELPVQDLGIRHFEPVHGNASQGW